MEGPLLQQQIDDIVVQQPTEQSGDFFVSHKHARSCLYGLGLCILEAVYSLEAEDVCGLVRSVGNLFVDATDGILHIVCKRGSYNEPVDQLLAVLPNHLSCMYIQQSVKILQLHHERMLPVFKAEGIESIRQNFLQFLQAIR